MEDRRFRGRIRRLAATLALTGALIGTTLPASAAPAKDTAGDVSTQGWTWLGDKNGSSTQGWTWLGETDDATTVTALGWTWL